MTTTSPKTSVAVRSGGVAVFALAILGLGAVIGLPSTGPGRTPVDMISADRLPSAPFGLVVAVAVTELVLLFLGTLLVVGYIGDVRRRRALMAVAAEHADPALVAALDRVSGAVDSDATTTALVEGARSLTRFDDVVVVLTGDAADGADGLAGDPGVLRVLAAGAPSRWTEADADRAVAAAPLVVEGRTVGALVGVRSGSHPVALGDLDLLCQLAEVATVSAPPAVDDVTGLPGRRRLDRDLDATVAGVGLAVVGIDHFLRLTHEHGATVADGLLRDVAEIVRLNVRDGDIVYRYADQQFGVLLPGATEAETAEVAERLRGAVEANEFELAPETTGRITVSVGTVVADSDDLAGLTTRAEGALSEAERFGRNRVVGAGDRG